MALTPIEIIAVVFALFAFAKIVVIVIKRKAWYNAVVKPVYGNPKVTAVVFVILAVVVFYFLLRELTIVQIFAVLTFSAFLIGWGFLLYTKDLLSLTKKIYDRKLSPWVWVQMLVWLVLILWVLYEIFAV